MRIKPPHIDEHTQAAIAYAFACCVLIAIIMAVE